MRKFGWLMLMSGEDWKQTFLSIPKKIKIGQDRTFSETNVMPGYSSKAHPHLNFADGEKRLVAASHGIYLGLDANTAIVNRFSLTHCE